MIYSHKWEWDSLRMRIQDNEVRDGSLSEGLNMWVEFGSSSLIPTSQSLIIKMYLTYLNYLWLFSQSLPLCLQRRYLLLINQALFLPVQWFLTKFLKRQLKYLTPKCLSLLALLPRFTLLSFFSTSLDIHPFLHSRSPITHLADRTITYTEFLAYCAPRYVFLNLTP